jgi:PDZ domain
MFVIRFEFCDRLPPCLLAWIALWLMVCGQSVVAGAESTVTQIQGWIRQLEDDDFRVREQAENSLAAAGASSIGPLEAVLHEISLEGMVRGLNSLAAIASQAEEETTRDAAFEAMERLAASSHETLANHAAPCLGVIRKSREKESIAWLMSKGAALFLDAQEIRIGQDWQGNDQDLRRLAYLPNIRHVRFEGEKVNEQWLKQLARLPNLQELTLKRIQLSPAGLELISQLESLSTLKLLYFPLPPHAVESLQKLKGLEYASVFGSNLTPEQAATLIASSTKTRWDIRRGAFLGVHVQKISQFAEVSTVQPNSAAQKAGVQIGDYIQTLRGEKIANFEELQAVIGKLEAGTEVEMELLRGDRPMKLKITLGEWD